MPRRSVEQAQVERDFLRIFQQVAPHKRRWEVWQDFVEIAALALSQLPHKAADREERYMALIGKYSKEEALQFKEMLWLIPYGLGDQYDRDFLGKMFMELELGDHWKRQFFTPMAMAHLLARLNVQPEKLKEEIEEKGFITLHDCAVGAGALVIAFAGQMEQLGYDPTKQLHAKVIDKDPTAFHMCYIQLATLGVPAEVWLGDTLRMQMQYGWGTSAHWALRWDLRINDREKWEALVGKDRAVAEHWRKAFALIDPKPLAQEEPSGEADGAT
jgi:hypothetical protein